MIQFTNPAFTHDIGGFYFSWPDTDILIELSRIDHDAKGEIGVFHINGQGKALLKYGNINLLSTRAVDDLVKSLSRTTTEFDWQTALTYVAGKTLQCLREGQPTQNINAEPNTKAVAWCVAPLLPEGEPSTIFSPGGSGKSLVAEAIAIIKSCGVSLSGLPCLAPKRGNVLILDWERNEEIHKQRISAIKHSYRIEDDKPIHYIKCDHPISADIEYLCRKVADLQIDLVVIDSQMAATAGLGHGMTDAEISGIYYNLLRRFKCTTLTIDHVSKSVMAEDSGHGTPFGSIVKWNRATCVYSVKSIQETESDTLSLAMKHEKFNLGRKQAARGIRIEFENDDDDQLIGIRFASFDLANEPTLAKNVPQWQIVRSIIRDEPKAKLTCAEIAARAQERDEDTNLDAKRVFDVMHKKPRVFVRVGDEWGLIAVGNGVNG